MLKGLRQLWRRRSARDGVVSVLGSTRGDGAQYATTTGAMRIAAVFRCVRLLSESVASLPMRYLKRDGEIYTPDGGSRLNYLLQVAPNRDYAAFDFWTEVVRHILLFGNAYVVPVYLDDEISRLALVSPGAVTSHDWKSGKYIISDPDNGISGTYYEREILHLTGQYQDYVKGVGIGVIAYARQTLGIAGIAEEETLDRYKNGGSVRGIISGVRNPVMGTGYLQDDQLSDYAKDFDAMLRSGARILGLNGHAQFSPLAQTAADMQFLETRKFTVREICRYFGVHPSYVFDDTSNNYKSAEMANAAFLSNTLNPLLLKIENEFNRKLVDEWRWGRYKFEFDRTAIYALDLTSQADYLTKMVALGAYTLDDCRIKMNKQPIEGGDRVLVSANLRPLEDLSKDGKEQPTADA